MEMHKIFEARKPQHEIPEESIYKIKLQYFSEVCLTVCTADFIYYHKYQWSIMFLTVNGK